MQETAIIKADPALQLYYQDLGQRRGNNGILSDYSVKHAAWSLARWMRFSSLQITEHTLSDLLEYKRNHPTSVDIERSVKTFALQPNLIVNSNAASCILGIFRANFAPLNVRINTHFTPPQENCTRGIFLEIFHRLTQEQQDMIQWALYFPERAKACYRIPFDDIDLSRTDYAILKCAGRIPNSNGIRNKMRVDHPGLVPIDFAQGVINNSKAAGNNCPFPTHEWLWSQISEFALREYKVRLVSNYTRKLFEWAAEESTIKPSQAAFLMGDKTKLERESVHLPLIYLPTIRPMEREQFIQNYTNSGIVKLLTL